MIPRPITSHNSASDVHYPDSFFDSHEQGVLRSARLIAPNVLRLLDPKSIVDIGCGRGTWLRAFKELGVQSVLGIDGDYVNPSKLLMEKQCFLTADLSKPFKVPGRFDLALCLEVAEHLPESMAGFLVEQLTDAAPAILFSAAIPGQDGTCHINEQMPAYWRDLFRARGYVLLDPIRPVILTDARIESWYRQNLLLYVSEGFIRERPELEQFRLPVDHPGIEWVQAYVLDRPQELSALCRQLYRTIWSKARKKIGHLRAGLRAHKT
jgi:SAM-dependent methyltransferase